MQNKFIDNGADTTIILFHGTGGDESDFLILNDLLGKKYNLLGLKVNVEEDGYTRFFKRISMGVFDQESIKEESKRLYTFLEQWMKSAKTDLEHIIYLGYSNGANMILALLFYYPDIIQNFIALHPMLPFEKPETLDLTTKKGFVSYGMNDQMINPLQSLKVIGALEKGNVTLTVGVYPSGHEISRKELDDVIDWIKK